MMSVNLAGFEEIELLAWRYPRPEVLDISPFLRQEVSMTYTSQGSYVFRNSEARFVKCPQKVPQLN